MKKSKKHLPKFKTKYLKRLVPSNPGLKTLKYWCGVFNRSGLAPSYGAGSHGNLSFRLKPGENRFMITASALRMKRGLTRGCFFEVADTDVKRNRVAGVGVRQPSSETFLHALIYQKRKDINAVFHGHCPDILKSAVRLKLAQTSADAPYGTIELADRVGDILTGRFFLIIKNHGFVSLGKNMDEAGRRALKILKKSSAGFFSKKTVS